MAKRIINMGVLPGQPTDGTGQMCIHLFVRDPNGSFTEPHVLHQEAGKPMKAIPTRGRLACNRRKLVTQVKRNNVTTVVMRSDDPRAVTCPRCAATSEFADLMKRLEAGN